VIYTFIILTMHLLVVIKNLKKRMLICGTLVSRGKERRRIQIAGGPVFIRIGCSLTAGQYRCRLIVVTTSLYDTPDTGNQYRWLVRFCPPSGCTRKTQKQCSWLYVLQSDSTVRNVRPTAVTCRGP